MPTRHSKRFWSKASHPCRPFRFSERLYVQVDAKQVHLFRFLLEAHDNLGIMTVIDRWKGILLIRCSPHQTDELIAVINAMQQTLPIVIVPVPARDEEKGSLPGKSF